MITGMKTATALKADAPPAADVRSGGKRFRWGKASPALLGGRSWLPLAVTGCIGMVSLAGLGGHQVFRGLSFFAPNAVAGGFGPTGFGALALLAVGALAGTALTVLAVAVRNVARAGRPPLPPMGGSVGQTGGFGPLPPNRPAHQAETPSGPEPAGCGGEQMADPFAEQGQLFETVFNSIPHIIAIKDREARYVFVNEAWCAFHGLPSFDAIGKTPLEVTAHRDSEPQLFFERDREFLDGNMLQKTWETPRLGPDGEERVFHSNNVQIRDAGGMVAGMVQISVDVTDRVRVERELRETQRLQQTVFDALPQSVSVADANHRLLLVNRNALLRNGLKPDKVKGASMAELGIGTQDERAVFNALDQEVMETGNPILGQELQWTLPNGQRRLVASTHVPFLDDGGGVAGVVCVEEDVTEQRKLETELRQAQRMDAVGKLAAGVAHDFNNMLQIIKGYSELAALHVGEEGETGEHLGKVLGAAERAATLTRQLLAFSRQQVLEKRDFDVNETIDDLMKMLGRVIGETIEVQVHLAPGASQVHGDRGMIEQVLLNLCVNARDAMPQGGRLTIETETLCAPPEFCAAQGLAEPGPYLLVTVSDSGVGIASDHLAHIFEPFYTTKEIGKGTGIGLAVVYGIVEQHGGKISVFSEPGQGTAFRIALPAFSATGDDPCEEDSAQWPRGTETILVAEDDDGLLEMATELLREQGFRILPVVDGARACEAFAENPGGIDLLLLDVVMPNMGGREACERIRGMDPQVPVIFCTGYSADALDSEFLRETGARVLRKPFSPTALLTNVREMLDAGRGAAPSRKAQGGRV